jgi:cytochrome c-type protein NapB
MLMAVVVAVGLVAFIRGVAADQAAGQRSIPDRDIGLRKTTLAEDRAPEPFVFTDDVPGGNTLLPRAYDGAPPLIPHTVDGFVPITQDGNFCVVCHATGSTDPEDPPQVPRSHRIDWRAAPDVVREDVAGARWVCTSCHVPQSDAQPLVGSTFGRAGR